MSETATSWYIEGDGTIVIPPTACSHCGHGPGDDGTELHYFGCPASGEDYDAWEREHDEDDSHRERYAHEADDIYEYEPDDKTGLAGHPDGPGERW